MGGAVRRQVRTYRDPVHDHVVTIKHAFFASVCVAVYSLSVWVFGAATKVGAAREAGAVAVTKRRAVAEAMVGMMRNLPRRRRRAASRRCRLRWRAALRARKAMAGATSEGVCLSGWL